MHYSSQVEPQSDVEPQSFYGKPQSEIEPQTSVRLFCFSFSGLIASSTLTNYAYSP